MGKFIGNLHVQYVDGDSWILVDQDKSDRFGFKTDKDEEIYPDNFFEHDFASIPSIFQILFPKVGHGKYASYGPAALIHDWLFSTGKIDGKWITRKYADDIFTQCNIAMNVAPWITWIMYKEIRMWGSPIWYSHGDDRP